MTKLRANQPTTPPRVSRRLVSLLAIAAQFAVPAARADDEAVQRALLERQQQSDAFSLQLRQSQQRIAAPRESRQQLEATQLQERLGLERRNDQERTELRASPAESAAGTTWGPRLESQVQELNTGRRRSLDLGVGH